MLWLEGKGMSIALAIFMNIGDLMGLELMIFVLSVVI